MIGESQAFFYVSGKFFSGRKVRSVFGVGSLNILKSGAFVSSGWIFDGKGQPI
jgi:hypothetical protein